VTDETLPPETAPPAPAADVVEQTPRPEILPSDSRPAPAADQRPRRERRSRPDLAVPRQPIWSEAGGFRLRLEPADVALLRELPGAGGKTDQELGAEFLESQRDKLLGAVAGDVEPPAELQVLVDPFSRQAFLVTERRIRGIVSF
jgi:hypothetical protein